MELVSGINAEIHNNRFVEWKQGFERKLLLLPPLLRDDDGQLGIENGSSGNVIVSADIVDADAGLISNVAIKIETEDVQLLTSSQDSTGDVQELFPGAPQSPRPGPSNANQRRASTAFSAPPRDTIQNLHGHSSSTWQNRISTGSNINDAPHKSASLLPLVIEDESGILAQLISNLNQVASVQSFSKELGNTYLETKELETKWDSKFNSVLANARANLGNQITDTVLKGFQNYAKILRCEVVSYNDARRCRFNVVTEIFNGRFKKIEENFGEDWLGKTLADIEALYVNDDICELKLLDYFDSDWKDFYYDLKKRKVQILFKLVEMIKKYRDKMLELCNKNICCFDDPTLSNYHNEATRVSLSKPDEYGQYLLDKAKQVVQNIRASLQTANSIAIRKESDIANRAVSYAMAAYCKILETKLKRPLQLPALKTIHETAKNFIEENFFGVPEFLYTEPWKRSRQILQVTIESELSETIKRNESSQKLQKAFLNNEIQVQVSAFRRKVLVYLSDFPDAADEDLQELLQTELRSAVRAVENAMGSNDDRIQIEARLLSMFQDGIHLITATWPGQNQSLPGFSGNIPAVPPLLPPSTPIDATPSPRAPSTAGSTRSVEYIFSDVDVEGDSDIEALVPENGTALFFHVQSASVLFQVDGKNIHHTKSLTIDLKQAEIYPVYVTNASVEDEDVTSFDVYESLLDPNLKKISERFWIGSKQVQLWSEEIIAIFLHQLKAEVQARWKKDISTDCIAIALPSCIHSSCKQRIKSALRLAGMSKSVFVQTTTAIGMSYLTNPPPEPAQHYVLAVYMESLVLDVALLRVENGKFRVVAMEGIDTFPELMEDNFFKMVTCIIDAIQSVTEFHKIQPEDIRECICSVYHPKLFKEPDSATSKEIKSLVTEIFDNSLLRKKFSLPPIQDGFLQGLFQISKNRSTEIPDLYQEVFPTFMEIIDVNGVPGNQLTFVMKNAVAENKTIRLSVAKLGSHEEPCKIMSRSGAGSIKIMELSLNENMKRKHSLCQLHITINKEGIISTASKSSIGRNKKQIKVKILSDHMQTIHMAAIETRLQKIIKASETLVANQQKSTRDEPPIKRRRETIAN